MKLIEQDDFALSDLREIQKFKKWYMEHRVLETS